MKMSSLVRRIVEKMIDHFEEESDKLLFVLGHRTCRNWVIRRIRFKITANRAPVYTIFPDTGHNWSKIHWIFVLVGRLNFLGGKAKWNGVEKNIFLTSFAVGDHFVKIQLIQQDKLGNNYYDLHLPRLKTEVF